MKKSEEPDPYEEQKKSAKKESEDQMLQAKMDYCCEQMKSAKGEENQRNEALLHALYYYNRRHPLPKWLYEGLFELLSNRLRIGGLTGAPGPSTHATRAHQFRIDSLRTQAAEDARKQGARGGRVWDEASQKLAAMGAACSVEAIKKSYDKIQKFRRWCKEVWKVWELEERQILRTIKKESKINSRKE